MKNSHRYFKNTDCEYYPCHFAGQNCLFCFCPLYQEPCNGHYDKAKFVREGLRDCSKCVLPHIDNNYDSIIDYFTNPGKDMVWRFTYRPAKGRKKK